MDAGVTQSVVSCSGLNAGEYRRVFRKDAYGRVLGNLYGICESDRFARCRTTVSFRTDSLLSVFGGDFWRLRRAGMRFSRPVFLDSWGGLIT